MEFSHVSVMPNECIDGLNIKPDGIYVDATTGGAGHSLLIAQRLSGGRLICLDRDDDALKAAKIRLSEHLSKVTFIKCNFEDMEHMLSQAEISQIDGVLFDFGVSSYQLDEQSRGFSYMQDAVLDMRMDRQQQLTAHTVVNTYSQQQLKTIIADYGEERFATRIARAITEKREGKPIETTLELAGIIKSAMPAAAKSEKQHPAKRTFQAIRIEVNGELRAVEQGVAAAIKLLSPGGRLVAISFHSLEDRIVKQGIGKAATGCICPPEFPVCICNNKPAVRRITKGAQAASADEIKQNPRARSAKVRIAEKI